VGLRGGEAIASWGTRKGTVLTDRDGNGSHWSRKTDRWGAVGFCHQPGWFAAGGRPGFCFGRSPRATGDVRRIGVSVEDGGLWFERLQGQWCGCRGGRFTAVHQRKRSVVVEVCGDRGVSPEQEMTVAEGWVPGGPAV